MQIVVFSDLALGNLYAYIEPYLVSTIRDCHQRLIFGLGIHRCTRQVYTGVYMGYTQGIQVVYT